MTDNTYHDIPPPRPEAVRHEYRRADVEHHEAKGWTATNWPPALPGNSPTGNT